MASSQSNRLFIVSDSASNGLIAVVSAKSREDVINYLTLNYKKYIPLNDLRSYYERKQFNNKQNVDKLLYNSFEQLYADFKACAPEMKKDFVELAENYIRSIFLIFDQGEMEVIKL